MELGPKQKQWVEALRSGEYKQGRNCLYIDGTYCCLGVAQKIFLLQEPSKDFLHNSHSEIGLKFGDGSFDFGTYKFEKGKYETLPFYDSLAEMNDAGCSFEEIADTIEKYSDLLFSKSV